MNWNEMEGNWEQFRGKVQTQWGKLTNDDLAVIKGRRTELAGKIQERYGKAQGACCRIGASAIGIPLRLAVSRLTVLGLRDSVCVSFH